MKLDLTNQDIQLLRSCVSSRKCDLREGRNKPSKLIGLPEKLDYMEEKLEGMALEAVGTTDYNMITLQPTKKS